MLSNVEDFVVFVVCYNGYVVFKIKYECDVIFNRVFDFFFVFNKVVNGFVLCFFFNFFGGDEVWKEFEGFFV